MFSKEDDMKDKIDRHFSSSEEEQLSEAKKEVFCAVNSVLLKYVETNKMNNKRALAAVCGAALIRLGTIITFQALDIDDKHLDKTLEKLMEDIKEYTT